MDTFVATVFLIICVLLIVVVLLQKGRGGGMGGLFGGAGSSAFGTRTGDVFTWVTIVLVAFFILLAVGVNLWFRPERSRVSAPEFIPAAGPIDGRALVTIRSKTPGADVYYVVGEGDAELPEPDKSHMKWDAAFSIRPGQTVKARAFLSGWHPSETVVAAYLKQDASPAPATQPATTRPAIPATAPSP